MWLYETCGIVILGIWLIVITDILEIHYKRNEKRNTPGLLIFLSHPRTPQNHLSSVTSHR